MTELKKAFLPTWVALALFCFAPALADAASTPPTIPYESASQITASNAVLEAEIDPHDATDGVFYQFQIAKKGEPLPPEMQCQEMPPPGFSICIDGEPEDNHAVPQPLPLEITGAESPTVVTLNLEEAGITLRSGTIYRFRVVAADRRFTEDTAEWEPPEVLGESKSFTTEWAPPTVTTDGVSQITTADATLEATIDPGSEDGAYYQFQIAKDPSEFAKEIQCPPQLPEPFIACNGTESASALPLGHIPRRTGKTAVELDLADAGITLEPGTIYYYRALGANAVPYEDTIEWYETTVGATKSFTTETAPPTITAENATEVTATGATLEATIDPGSSEDGTYYQFQIAKDPSELAEEFQCPPPPPQPSVLTCTGTESTTALPIDQLSQDAGETTIALDLSEVGVTLEPSTTYYYRVLAANAVSAGDILEWEEPTVLGGTESFKTQDQAPPPEPPSITNESATAITPSDATLNAEIDPKGEETTYRFQIDTTGQFEFDLEDECLPPPGGFCPLPPSGPGPPLPPGLVEPPVESLPGLEGPQKVSVDLNAIGATLQPSTTYYLRVIATHDGSEIVEGDTKTFTTAAREERSSGTGTCSSGSCPGTQPGGSGPLTVTCKKGQVKRHGVCVRKHRPCRRKGHHAKRCHHKGRLR